MKGRLSIMGDKPSFEELQEQLQSENYNTKKLAKYRAIRFLKKRNS